MKLKNVSIGTQLRLGLGLILAFVVALGALAWVQSGQLWLQTQTIYDHPLQVGSAIGEFEADVLSMHRDTKDLLLAANDQEIAAVLQGIEANKARALRQLDIVSDRYLGPREDLTTLYDEFVKWNVIREETVRLLRAGKTAEVLARVKPGGSGHAQADVLIGQIRKVEAFARSKADQLYRNAMDQSIALNRQLVVIVAAVLLLSLVIAWLLLQGIKTPLAELTAAAEQFRQGQLDVRSGYVSGNEFGTLSTAFNALADTIQLEMRIEQNAAQLAEVMLREDELRVFCRELLKALLKHTGSQVGAVYFLNAAKTAFEHFESIGLTAGGRAAFSATELEGEFGAALATRQIHRITDIPADTRFAFAAVSGDFTPREILTIPVLSDHHVSAMISLASVRAYDAPSLRLVNNIWSMLTARVNGVLGHRQLQEFAERLEHQNCELETQQKELVAQTNELTQQNTELDLQKKQLDEANRLKSVFLSNMSHELRTPLNSVIALSGVLSRRLVQTIPAEEYGYLEVIERNGRLLLSLINDILDLSRIEAGREEIQLGQFSLRELVGEVVAMLEPQAREQGTAVLNQLGDDLPPVTSDRVKCRHILQNLIGNAVKFTEQGQVTITADIPHSTLRTPQSTFLISVTDTGIGIATNQLPHLFEEFWQADNSASRKYEGTGLGLAIAKKYAELLQGGITVRSTPGKGSTFSLRLPLTLSLPGAVTQGGTRFAGDSAWAIAGQGAVAAGQGAVAAGQGQDILLVEDNEPAVIQLTDILTRHGYAVRVAHNGHQALAHIEKSLPDAVILDLMMPEMDGFEVLRQIRGTEQSARLPVLILTAKHVTKEELSFLKGNHVRQLIQKGDINQTELLAAVARMVAPPPEPPTPPARLRVRKPHSGKPVILVVEDNPDSLRTMRALLRDAYVILEAVDGRAGVEQARTHQPDLILMDIAMPVLDGVQALREIRQDETLRHIPVIAATASAMQGDRETILAHGFDGYITKPVDAELLKKTLREVLD